MMSATPESSNPTRFTKREWVHLIITLSLVQACIWFAAYHFGTSNTALGYISFAGTIISIILAVLAIGYTYGESHRQKNSSDTLSSQIDSLIKIKDKLEIQADALSDVKLLKDDIDKFKIDVLGHFTDTKVKLDTNNENLLNFIKKDSRFVLQNESMELTVDYRDKMIELVLLGNLTVIVQLILLIYIVYKIETKDTDYESYLVNNKYLNELETIDKNAYFTIFASAYSLFDIFDKLEIYKDGKIHVTVKTVFSKCLVNLKFQKVIVSNEPLHEFIKYAEKCELDL